MSGYDFSKLEYVDDASSDIHYTGSWTLSSSSGSYNSTVHSTTEIGASASIRFQGSFVFIALTIPSCEPGSSNTGTRVRYDLTGNDPGQLATLCSSTGTAEGVDAYRVAVNGNPNIFREIRVTNMGSDPNFPLVFDRFAYLPLDLGTSSVISRPATTTFDSRTTSTTMPASAIHTDTPAILIPSITLPPSLDQPATGSNAIHSVDTPASASTQTLSAEQSGSSSLSRIILGTCISIGLLLLLVGITICCLRRRARARLSKTLPQMHEVPDHDNPFDDIYGRPISLPHSGLGSLSRPNNINHIPPSPYTPTSSSQNIQVVESAHNDSFNSRISQLTTTKTRSGYRPRSPNSLFNFSSSRSSTPNPNPNPNRACTLDLTQKSEHTHCFCPSCDSERTTSAAIPPPNHRKHRYRPSSAFRSIVASIASSSANSNATAAPAYSGHGHGYHARHVESCRASGSGSIDIRSVRSNHLSSDVLPPYDALHPMHSIHETPGPLSSSSPLSSPDPSLWTNGSRTSSSRRSNDVSLLASSRLSSSFGSRSISSLTESTSTSSTSTRPSPFRDSTSSSQSLIHSSPSPSIFARS